MPDSTARVVRDSLAASPPAMANGYAFAIASGPCPIVEITNASTFCLVIQNYTGGPDLIEVVPALCRFPGETH